MLFDLKEKMVNYNNKNYYIIYLVIALFVSTITMILIVFKNKKKIRIEKMFCILAAALGIIYLVASPLFTGSDEHNHYYRIYEISSGVLITPVKNNKIVGSKMSKSLAETFENHSKEKSNRNIYIKYHDEIEMMKNETSKEKIQYGKEYTTEYVNTALYSPIQYFPQVVGFLIGKVFNVGPFWLGELGRIFNLIFYILICTIFLHKLPRMKTFASIVLLSPTLLSNATTLSADGFTNALIFAFIAMIIYYIYKDKKLTWRDKALLLFLSIMLSFCKIVYLPFILFLIVIPKERFSSTKRKVIFIIICLLIGGGLGAGWIKITDRYFNVYYLNTEIQKAHILKNLFGYFIVVLRTYCDSFSNLALNIFGGNNLYHSQLPVYNIISVIYIAIVALCFFEKESAKKYDNTNLKINDKIILISLMLVIIALITTAIYIQCTANFIMIDSPIIYGLQGRYYLPIIMCILLLGSKDKIKQRLENTQILTDTCIICNMFVILQMVVRFLV